MIDYGKDISCTDALHTGRYATGLRVVAEAVYRRLITRPGELLDDPSYGFDVAGYLGGVTSPAEIARLPGLIRQELQKDGRVETAEVEVSEITSGPEREWSVSIDVYTGSGSFALVLAVSSVSARLVGLS